MDDVSLPHNAGRRATDLEPMSSDMPWWIRAIGLVGVPSAIAIYLVYALVSNIVPMLVNINQTLTDHMTQMATFVNGQGMVSQQNERIIRILQSSCINQAKNSEDRERCLR